MNRRAHVDQRFLANSQIFRRRFAPILLLLVAHFGALVEAAQAGPFYRRYMNKHVLAAAVGLNKSVSFGRVKPLHSTCRHVRTPY
jgi:hypothetical protein